MSQESQSFVRDRADLNRTESSRGDLGGPELNRTELNRAELSSAPSIKRDYALQVAGNLFVSFRYAWAGIHYAFTTQRNFRLHVVVGTLALALGFYLELPSVEIAVICLTIGAVMALELLNTALESVVDLTVKQTYHELAKIAKDCAAGAVLVSAIVSALVALVLLVPPLLSRFHSLV